MIPDTLPIYPPCVVIWRNQDFYAFAPVYLITLQFDPGAWHPPGIGDEAFGNAVLEALSASETMQGPFNQAGLEERYALTATDEGKQRRKGMYDVWVANARTKFGYKTRKKMFQRMVHATVRKKDGALKAEIHEHVKMEGWSGVLESYTFDEGTDPQVLGRCLRGAIDDVFSEDLF